MANTERWTPTTCPICSSRELMIRDDFALCEDCHKGFSFADLCEVAWIELYDERPEMIHGRMCFVHPDLGLRATTYDCPTCGKTAACIHYDGQDVLALTQRKPYCYWCCEQVQTKPWKPPLKVKRHTDTRPKEEAEALEEAGQKTLFE